MKDLIKNHPDWIKEARELVSKSDTGCFFKKVLESRKKIEEHDKKYKKWLDKFSQLVKEKVVYEIADEMGCGYWDKRITEIQTQASASPQSPNSDYEAQATLSPKDSPSENPIS